MDARDQALPARIGRYRIERLLGRGAMGRVLLGRDDVLDREVAVKLLRDDLTLAPEQRAALLARMQHEAKACARVTHPNIVALFDMGDDPAFGLYLVFEYAEGTTLKERLVQSPLPVALAARLARDIGGALSTAHANGVLHRDVKPENIILTEHGGKVADFGIARVPNSTLTRDGGLLGTPAYSAPECIADGEFSAASDQFSLAATLYEALSQRRAFPGEDAVTVAARIQNEEPPAIAESCGLDPHVDGVLARGLAKNPEHRFASAGEFGDALAEALGYGTRGALPTLPDTQHRLLQQAQPTSSARSAVGGFALGALIGVGAFQLSSGLRENPAPRVEPTREEKPPAVAWLSPAPVREKPRASPSASAKRAQAAAPSSSATAAAVAEPDAAAAAETDAGEALPDAAP